jgi:hypothetical protein
MSLNTFFLKITKFEGSPTPRLHQMVTNINTCIGRLERCRQTPKIQKEINEYQDSLDKVLNELRRRGEI